jgi:GT2 family glycosyltransferase
MTTVHSPNAGSKFLAVIVLYMQSPEESLTASSLTNILQANAEMASHFSLLLYDNSPESHQVRGNFPFHYCHDPENGGLVAAYNSALSRAEEEGCNWLLLLDQDTTLTWEFFSELLACVKTLRKQDKVAAIVPRLMAQGAIKSPAEYFIDYIRHQFKPGTPAQALEIVGVHSGRISAYNSGASLSVSVLRSIGGFPKEFWLDYLDHAIFHALYAGGHQVYVLRAVLSHDLGGGEWNTIPIWRFRNLLNAQALFVKRAGRFSDRLLYRLWLLRSIRRLRADCHDKRIWKETAMRALSFHAPASSVPGPPATRYTAKGL